MIRHVELIIYVELTVMWIPKETATRNKRLKKCTRHLSVQKIEAISNE